MKLRFALSVLSLGAGLAPLPATTQVLPSPLSPEEAREARQIVESMKVNERGPYSAIRWYCADGTVHPPQGTPCSDRGGGVQHAETGAGARRLETLQVHVGTILQGVDPDSLLDAAYGNHWLKELVLGQYLYEVDDGWVLRRARYYRGARQIEDEEARGSDILADLLSDPAWTRRNFLLMSRLVTILPHAGGGTDDRTRRIRNLATEIANLDPGFLQIRIKIHSLPSEDDLRAVEEYVSAGGATGELAAKLDSLRAQLASQYDPARGRDALARYETLLEPEEVTGLEAVRAALDRGASREAVGRMAALAAGLRQAVETSPEGKQNLDRMDLLGILQAQAFLLAQGLRPEDRAPESRLARIRWLVRYFDLAYASGFLSGREREALEAEAQRVGSTGDLDALQYREGIRYLARSLDWALGRVRSVFGPTQQRYLSFEPLAQGFLDAEVRGSILLPLAGDLSYLAADADEILGASHDILGVPVAEGIRALNPGLAQGTLDFLKLDEEVVDGSRIYVLPVLPPELKPVAGVLTLEEGNLLSHVQLLARNLGIPNASVSREMEGRLREMGGREVLYAVSPLGRVILKGTDALTGVEATLLDTLETAPLEKVHLDTSRLRLERILPLPLGELRASASGVFVGPKAANLGQLAFYFPEHVAPGVALPFGMFVRHADRPFGSDATLLEELQAAYREADRRRQAGTPEAEVDAYMFQALEHVRTGILGLPWLPEVEDAIVSAVEETFGPDLGGGVFVRSDTNVEDLPQFSGAGLNLTLPHRRTMEEILKAVREVWTSPFSERAYLWRKEILAEQGQVYPSVLLLASVPSEKSGVLITAGLEEDTSNAFTVVTAEGVGGGVEGEEAETILVWPDGSTRLLTQAKAPRRRALRNREGGGVEWLASAMPDTLLLPEELIQLRDAAEQWKTRFAPGDSDAVWDMEFGFVAGKLWLFQVRPFIRARNAALLERLKILDEDVSRRGSTRVSLLTPI